MKETKKPGGCVWMFVGCAAVISLAFTIGGIAFRAKFKVNAMRGASMAPALVAGDRVVWRPTQEIHRGDLVVYENPLTGTTSLHRMIALPGQTVALRDNVAVVGGIPLEEPYAWTERKLPALRDFPAIRIPQNSYFLLGDNRDNANDSRYIGFVPREKIRGRVVFVLSVENGVWRP